MVQRRPRRSPNTAERIDPKKQPTFSYDIMMYIDGHVHVHVCIMYIYIYAYNEVLLLLLFSLYTWASMFCLFQEVKGGGGGHNVGENKGNTMQEI